MEKFKNLDAESKVHDEFLTAVRAGLQALWDARDLKDLGELTRSQDFAESYSELYMSVRDAYESMVIFGPHKDPTTLPRS